MKTVPIIAAAALAVSACTTVTTDGEPPARSVPDTCKADAGQRFVGERPSVEVGAAILQATSARELRWLAPGTIVTMEYKYGRVSVAYDESYRIVRVSCG